MNIPIKLPLHVGEGYEQCEPGIYIFDGDGTVILTAIAKDEDVPLTKEFAESIVRTINSTITPPTPLSGAEAMLTPRTDAEHRRLVKVSEGPNWIKGRDYVDMRAHAEKLERELQSLRTHPDAQSANECPSCGSDNPAHHPATQSGGEVSLCHNKWHSPTADEILAKEAADATDAQAGGGDAVATQWRNIRHVVKTLADWAFQSKDHPQYGSSWLAMVNGLTANDGPEFKLEPLNVPTDAADAADAGRTESVNVDGIVAGIIKDIRGRSGIGNEWESIDVDIRNEIAEAWRDIIRAAAKLPDARAEGDKS